MPHHYAPGKGTLGVLFSLPGTPVPQIFPWEVPSPASSLSSWNFLREAFLFSFDHMACGTEIKPGPPALEAQSLNHWTTREFPQWLLIHFTVLCNHHPYLIAEHFHHSQRSLLPMKLSHPSTRQPLIYSPSLWICLFWTFHSNGITQHRPLCLVSFA